MTPRQNHQTEIIGSGEFQALGEKLIRRISEEMDIRANRPLTCHIIPEDLEHALKNAPVPVHGAPASTIMDEAVELMYNYSLFTSHPRFLGYVCPAADPLGMLADTLVASVNPNAASAMMSPIGHHLEKLVIRWLATILGMSENAGGILVSGGNASNSIGILAAREHMAPWPIREQGFFHPNARPLTVYATMETHGGIEKAVEAAGLGRQSIRSVPIDREGRMRVDLLKDIVKADQSAGIVPMCIAATIGTVGMGSIDPLEQIVEFAQNEKIWVHVDGAFGAAMALAPVIPSDFKAMKYVDSVSWDPHKWLRTPIETGCALLKDPNALNRTFGNRPMYYHFGDYADTTHYYEQGPQNTRHLRALKVWMSLKQHGITGHKKLIAHDISLNERFFNMIGEFLELEQRSCHSCISTFRYIPLNAKQRNMDKKAIDQLNIEILTESQRDGDYYLSNAIIEGQYYLRACFVNYQTQEEDLPRILKNIVHRGNIIHARSATHQAEYEKPNKAII